MGSLSLRERLEHPTAAEVFAWMGHIGGVWECSICEEWATGARAWWIDPNTVQGRGQLDLIGRHMLEAHMPDLEGVF